MITYTDKTAIENYIGESLDLTSQDLKMWIAFAKEYIDNYTDSSFGTEENPTATERRFDGNGEDELYIDNAKSIDSIKLDADEDPLSEEDYWTQPANEKTITSIKLKSRKFQEGTQNIIISATWGTEGVPKMIQQAATIIVTGLISNGNIDDEIKSEQIDDYKVTFRDKKQWKDFRNVEKMLDPYKRYSF